MRHPEKWKDECASLEAFLDELFDLTAPTRTHVHAFEDDLAGGFRISEITLTDGRGFESFMRGDGLQYTAALILAAEDYVRCFRVEPHRPAGWQSDIDIFAEAKDVLSALIGREPVVTAGDNDAT